MKVLLLEDGDIGRLGRTAALERRGHDVTALRWSDRQATEGAPPDHEVMVAVLSPDTAGWDRYPVIPELARLIAGRRSEAPTIAVLEPEAADNPLLALRLQRAGVDRVALGAAIRTVDDMHAVVVDDSTTLPVGPSDHDLAMVGVARGSDPDAVVAWVNDRLRGPLAEAYRNAFDPRFTQAASGLSRRQARTLRIRLTALAKIFPNPCYSGGGPVRDRSLPRWTEVVAVANLCRGIATQHGEMRGEGEGRSSASRAA